MSYLHCCSVMQKCRTYNLIPDNGYILCEVSILDKCQECGHLTLQLTRINFDNEISVYRLKNKKAKNFFEKIKNKIVESSENTYKPQKSAGNFYLNYGEYGLKKKCYSNLSTMKLGLFENLK